MISSIIKKFVAKQMARSKGVIANKKAVEFSSAAMEDRLMRNGFDPNAIKSESELLAVLNSIKQKENLAFQREFKDIFTRKNADVFDLQGKKIDTSKPIMGGKNIPETEEEILARIQKENKESAERLREKRIKEKMDDMKEIEDPEDMATGGRAGFKSGLGKSFLNFLKGVKKEKPFSGKEFVEKRKFIGADKIENKINQIKNEKVLKEAQEEFRKNPPVKFPEPGSKEYEEVLARVQRRLMGDRKLNATGGRAGFKMGRRAFLKLMGGVGAGIGALKTGLLKLTGKEVAPQVVKEVVQQTTKSTPPPYFFELANKIKSLGKPDKVTYADRVEIHRYTGKNGDEYELVEDLSTGDMKITKDKLGSAGSGDETYEGVMDRSVLEYKKGDVNIDPDKKIASKAPDEYDEYKVEFDVDGTEADADDMSEFIRKEIIEETTSEAPKIKKAGGGIARVGYFLGSGRQAGTALIREILKYFNRDQKIRISEMLRTFNTRELRKVLDELSTYKKFDVKESGMPMPQIIEDKIKKLNVGKEKILESVLGAANAARKLETDLALRQNEMIESAVKQGFDRQEAKELVEGMTTAIEKSAGGPPRFTTATDEGIMDVEMMLKDLKTQGDGRKLNSSGGIAGMLGE